MIVATIRMAVSAGSRDQALSFFRAMTGRSRVHPGCLSSRVYTDEQEDNVLMFEQVWGNEADLDRYLKSDEYQKILVFLETAIVQPEIKFNTVSSSTGIETIRRARGLTVEGEDPGLPGLKNNHSETLEMK